MREDLLHFVWKYKKLQIQNLITTQNENLEVLTVGTHNFNEGPDFFNAKLKIGKQLWAGNIELHVNSSDWFVHGHEKDSNYDNVILHVVWEDDVFIYRKDNSRIPTLELKNYISAEILNSYQDLFDTKTKTFINCEKKINSFDSFFLKNWLDRLYFERLESKSKIVSDLLNQNQNNWEQVLFILLFKNFGSKVNSDSFYSLAANLPFSVIRKVSGNKEQLESVLFGLSGLLNDEYLDLYFINLKKEYKYLKTKFDLKEEGVLKPEFFKLRPPNFPTIRLSQISSVYHKHQNLFSKLIEAKTVEDIYDLFEVTASKYWDNHFTFGKESKKNIKRLTKNFIDLLIINTILPLKVCYAKHIGVSIDEEVVSIISEIKAENNSVISNFNTLGVLINSAMDSQATLQMYNEYCTKNKCLQCAVGSSLLKDNK
ncbi:DUF2851 family protein [Cellulophaga sp. HaHaR_3_176]|uniref:DUF2851 family protein n=1 Tax=Cellulophaga sp. HaHaR_3_176 TaxID=1942464 RepID=UPI001C1F25C4|nr:DUF2851 family protein [Cellulophaga sp. HaHaR_3_176]QWX84414.1 DUF2851 family protein [Cellulophaga sp. HaHaR_3_176]